MLADDRYEEFLISVRRRFSSLTKKKERVDLFTTRAPDLFRLFLDSLPPSLQKENGCTACKRFLRRYGHLVTLAPDGSRIPLLWEPQTTPAEYAGAVRALAAAVSSAPIQGVFLSRDKVWGTPKTDPWTHLAVTPPESLLCKPPALRTVSQLAAEKAQDYDILCRGLEEFPLELVRRAHALLTSESLYRSEVCIGISKWLLELHEQRHAAPDPRTREGLTWRAVATAPPGYCHVRSTMISTLLADLAADLPFAQIKARFDMKMSPLQYQRPVAPPSSGNVARAEKIVAQLKAAGALERRFAKLGDIQTLWTPPPAEPTEKTGVFSRPKAREPSDPQFEVPQVSMTWDKFRRTVLPTAESIEFLVPSSDQPYMAMVTAQDPDAPPILQWDSQTERNPVTWYFYVNGSSPQRWNLEPGVYHPVTAVVLSPPLWGGSRRFAHHGEKVTFVLKGAWDREYVSGCGFFPEFLRSEYHEIRATMEAYAEGAVIAGKDEAEVCGIGLQKGVPLNFLFRVTARGGVRGTYKLDRWD